MHPVTGYRILEILYEEPRRALARAVRDSDDTPVLLEQCQATDQIRDGLRRALSLAGLIHNSNQTTPIDLIESSKHSTLVLIEFPGCHTLNSFVKNHELTIKSFLQIAKAITASLRAFHAQKLLHFNLSPQSILVDDQNQVKLIGFCATHLSDDAKVPQIWGRGCATYSPYISPEQTGRIAHSPDCRSDLWQLGVIFYELLVGKLPFNAEDQAELVHSLIALDPEFPDHLPGPIIEILKRLLTKDPIHRYQCAFGLEMDLQYCQSSLEHSGVLVPFTVGKHDVPHDLRIADTLYDRDRELLVLKEAYQAACQGDSTLLFVHGPAGIGRTAFIESLRPTVIDKGGHMVSSRFDVLQQSIPYSAIIQAFRDLAQKLLASNPNAAAAWRQHLLTALGKNGQIIVDVLPEMGLLLGPQPELPKLSSSESDARFNLVIQQFMGAIARPDTPLVLFLDDVQWADGASLDLLTHLLRAPEMRYFLLILGYRDNELEKQSGLTTLLQDYADAVRLTLRPLSAQSIALLLSETLHVPPSDVQNLADLILLKTQGNNFFVREFIKALHRKELLHFDHMNGRWHWDLTIIQNEDVTDNVIDLVSDHIAALSEETIDTLKHAAAIGSEFDLDTLTLVSEQEPSRIMRGLAEAVSENLVIQMERPGMWRFAHDRIKYSTYRQIKGDERPALHDRIGRLLLRSLPQEHQQERLFDIVNHLNIGRPLRHTHDDLTELARLNLKASIKAKTSVAYKPAEEYINIAQELIQGLPLSRLNYELSFNTVEIKYLSGNHEKIEELAEEALALSDSVLDKISIYELLIQYFNGSIQYDKSINTALLATELLGESLPHHPGRMSVLGSVIALLWKLRKIKRSSIEKLPVMTDEHKNAALRIWVHTAAVAYFTRPNLYLLMMIRITELSLELGVSEDSAFGFQTWGLIQLILFGNIDAAMEYRKIAISLNNRFNAKGISARNNFAYEVFISPWKQPLSGSPQRFHQNSAEALETGNLEYWAYSLWWSCAFQFISGQNLNEIKEKISIYLEQSERFTQKSTVLAFQLMDRYVNRLINPNGPAALDAANFNEESLRKHFLNTNNYTAYCYNQCFRLFFSWHAADYEDAMKAAAEISAHEDALSGQIWMPFYLTYQSLALSESWPKLSLRQKISARWRMLRNRMRMRNWARHAPMNYAHRYELLKAELARLKKQPHKATLAYDKALKLATTYGFVQDQGLIAERAATMFGSYGMHISSEMAWRISGTSWERWGATLFRERLNHRLGPVERRITPLSTTGIDNATVAKLAQAISSELVLDRLLDRLLDLAMENAGARQSALILLENGRLTVPAERNVEHGKTGKFRQNLPLVETDVPVSVVSYVTSTLKPVVLDDASGDTRFGRCARWIGRGRLSVLCVPIIHQGRAIGALYLENDRTAGAFSDDRVELLQVLASQSAIAIANARLFTELNRTRTELETYTHRLEQMVAERTDALAERGAALQESLEQLRDAQAQLVLREKLASLGQLTAGIAHEIKNPLNFVNNFSVLTRGLLDDFKTSIADGDLEEQEEIMDMMADNLSKIEHHGRRADAIVRGMLLHSRSGSSEFNPTDINRLIEDAARLAYHGVRTQNAKFACDIEFELDPSLDQIMVVAQSLMRVLVNLLTNAFYSTNQRMRDTPPSETYKPTVTLTTRNNGDTITIIVHDNGLGMTPEVKEKLFTPFFTTKPPGEGTGLGLSLGYETIVTEHSGTLNVDSILGSYAQFTIELPRRLDTREEDLDQIEPAA